MYNLFNLLLYNNTTIIQLIHDINNNIQHDIFDNYHFIYLTSNAQLKLIEHYHISYNDFHNIIQLYMPHNFYIL